MEEVRPREPQSAADYEDRTTAAVKSVLVEIGQILGSFRGKYTVIGGAVPWLLLNNEEMPHVGSLDVDLGLDAEALGDGEYATLIEALTTNGYQQRTDLRRFQLVRRVPAKDGPPIDVIGVAVWELCDAQSRCHRRIQDPNLDLRRRLRTQSGRQRECGHQDRHQ
jgi:hypothetical protein